MIKNISNTVSSIAFCNLVSIMSQKPGEGGDFRLSALRDLGNQLQIKAERMRLLARAEEGLGDGDYNPYSTYKMPSSEIAAILQEKQSQPVTNQPDSNIPVPTARERRRRKVKPTPGHTTIDIKQYRPGYTWNRGGRMKEIRIRHLARKYLCMWKKKVYGRITPSQARAHYQGRLKRIAFRAWHDMWWELRKEWRLVVRAECHHRYVLWLKTFRAWKEYIVKNRIKNSKAAIALQHASCKLSRKCLTGWLIYVEHRRGKNEANKRATEFHNTHLLRCTWQTWMSQHEVIQHRQHMESVALQFWAYRIQAQYWLIWQSKLNAKRSAVMNHYRAIRHHNTVCVRKCFKALYQYWVHRQQKTREKLRCEKLYREGLLQKTFAVWLEAYNYRLRVHEREDRINSLAETFQKRRVFCHWRHYIELQRQKYEQLADAENHYRNKLLRVGFSAFRLSVVQKHLKVMRKQMADQIRYRQLTQWGWNTWLSRCENKEELRIVTQSHHAWIHYRSVLLRKCFYQLQLYTEWRQHRQAQYARADAHYYMQVMPQYMDRIKMFVHLMKKNRENRLYAVEFRRENSLARFFYQWINQYELSKENRMNERMAILHYDGKLAKKYFKSWNCKLVELIKDNEKQLMAQKHYNEVLCRNHLLTWRNYIQDQKKSQRQDIEASRYYCRRITKTCIHAWIKYTRQRREKKRKTEKAQNHYRRRVCQRMITMWLHYVDTQRSIKARVEVMYRRKCLQFLGESFHMWRENLVELKTERQQEATADRHYTVTILVKVFTAWHRFSAIHAYKKSETQQWVMSARQHLDSKLLGIYFDKWRRSHSSHVYMRLEYERAVDHHSTKVLQKVIVTWKQFTKDSIKKALLRKQCVWFNTVRLTGHSLMVWKQAFSAAQVEKQKTSLALWHWSLQLNRKVLMAWYSYLLHRKHRKHRVMAAMERRRSRLLKDGVTQWLKVADDMSNMRKKFAVQQQAKNVYETYQVVLRCGLHWKHWASRQSKVRGGPKPVSQQQNAVTHSNSAAVDKKESSCSLASTPRFPVSLFNTPRDNAITNTGSREQVPAPVITASPARIKPNQSSLPQIGGATRARPRQPSFLMESLKRAGLFTENVLSSHPQQGHGQEDLNSVSDKPSVSDPPVKVERLNLSNLTTNQSDLPSDRTLTPHATQLVCDIDSSRSDRTVTLDNHIPFQKDLIVSKQLPENTHKQSMFSHKISNNSAVQNSALLATMPSVPSKQSSYVPNSSKFTLMTPADFLQKQSGRDNKGLNSEVIESPPVSECTSVTLTPRFLCDNTNHDHPLSETRSFRVTDFKEQITPRSTSSYNPTPREQLSSLGFEVQSKKSIQTEIIAIRNKLKGYDQKKKKLRMMQKQLVQLVDWLHDMEGEDETVHDEDVLNTRQEVKELTSDVENLKKLVEEEKMECASLVDHVKVLTAKLSS